ncbi:MAG: rod shape-determining protein MreD [Gammaproteobacteria bacterium]|nr:MAG: rod shape-determining protein MreD [Gammaproteobacteria bacterium]RLA10395.1 MAG: rod shape-determining protein MreD [Gammaproteobacteria bacterium]RLA12829.1 MAG: rod shape-determining protein MreD [Gammaproteobacteria bacterium]
MNDVANWRDGWLILTTLLAALIIDSMVLPQFLGSFRPDVLAVIVIYWSLMAPQRVGVGVAWVAGLLVDVSSSGLIGLHAMVLSMQAYITLMLYQQIRMLPRFQQTLFVLILMVLGKLLAMAVLGMTGRLPTIEFWFSLPASVVFWPLIYALVQRWRKRALLPS